MPPISGKEKRMNFIYQVGKSSFFTAVAIFLVGCTIKPALISAKIKDGSTETKFVEVVISADDAEKIKSREIYFWIVLVDCKNYRNRFPIKPYIDGVSASKFGFTTSGKFLAARGEVPTRVLNGFSDPCVTLEGGGYFAGKIESEVVPLVLDAK